MSPEPSPNEKRFTGYDLRDMDYYKRMNYYKAAKSAHLFQRTWPPFSDYTMPEAEIARLEARMDPFDFGSSIQPGRIVEVRREHGFEEDLVEAARRAWVICETQRSSGNALSTEEGTEEQHDLAIEDEDEFAQQFIMNDKTINSSEFSGSLELRNARRRAITMYIKRFLTIYTEVKPYELFQTYLVEDARNAWLNAIAQNPLKPDPVNHTERAILDHSIIQEENFAFHFIATDKSVDSSELRHNVQVNSSRRAANNLYINNFLASD